MTATVEAIIQNIDATLDGIERTPRMYGVNLETVELTALLLHSLRQFALRPEWHKEAPRRVMNAWRAKLAGGARPPGNGLFWSVLERDVKDVSERFEILARELSEFRTQLLKEGHADLNADALKDVATSVQSTRTGRLLAQLDEDNLREIADALGLEIPAGADVLQVRRALTEYTPATVHAVLASLSRETLRDLCKSLKLPAAGQGKSPYIHRLLERFMGDGGSGAQTLEIEVLPRQPRLAWQGMDQHEEVTSVPTQVVEIVRPNRAVDRSSAKTPELGLMDPRQVGGRVREERPNRLIWTNDNVVALQTLLDEKDRHTGEYLYRAKVDLVYIDPPFMVNSDFRGDNSIAIDLDDGIEATKEPSLVEFLAYKDTWRNGLDSFLVMLRRRLELLKDLLSPTGSIYVHLDWHAVHYVKVLMDDIFGYENFVNEIIWKRGFSHNDLGQGASHLGRVHDTVLAYSMTDSVLMSPVYTPYEASTVKGWYGSTDKDGRRYQLTSILGPGGAAKGNPYYELFGMKRYWRFAEEKALDLISKGKIIQPSPGAVPRFKRYLDESPGVSLQDVWFDLSPVNSQAFEALGYPTQKPIALLERIVALTTPPGGLVLDCFMGSGTTAEAAERLGRRWIGIDNGKYALHLARKRLIQLHGQPKLPEKPQYDYVECDECHNIERKEKKGRTTLKYEVKPFSIENMGVYQRAAEWQDFQRDRSIYRDEMVKVYGGEPVEISPLLHGRKGETWVHIGPLDGPVSSPQVWSIAHEAAQTDIKTVTILSADFDTLSVSEQDQIKESLGVKVLVKIIPSSAIDEVKRRIESRRSKGTSIIESMAVPAFYAPLSIQLEATVDGSSVKLTLKRCEVDSESFLASQRPTLKPLDNPKMTAVERKRVSEEHKRWESRRVALAEWLERAQSWQHFVDFWAIDWNYGERVGDDGKPIFETDWQSFRDRSAKKGASALTFTAVGQYDRPGSYRVAARVTDVFGNDGIATVQVTLVAAAKSKPGK